MILRRVWLRDFRCHEDIEIQKLGRLVVLVGENDVGKTVFLDALEYLLEDRRLKANDFRERMDGERCDDVIVGGEFELEAHDHVPDEWCCGTDKRCLRLTKKFSSTSTTVTVEGAGFADDRFDQFDRCSAADQKDALNGIDVEPESNSEKRVVQFLGLVESGQIQRVPKELQVRFSELRPYLPVIERTNSVDYADPAGLIKNTLRTVAKRVIEPPDDEGNPKEDKRLRGVRKDINLQLKAEIEKAEVELRKVHPGLKKVEIEANIDFSNAVSNVTLNLDFGEGQRTIQRYGQGTNRRMWMGLQEWQRQTAKDSVSSVITLYDEPDTNLHVRAQQKLFEHLSTRATDPQNRTQSFICTHSVHLIDRAQANTIRLLETDSDGKRVAKGIPSTEAADIREFLDDLGRSLGLTNTTLLYERAFLVVEGHSEKESIPLLYKTLHDGRTVTEDGIIVVNLHACSAWQAALQVLFESRREFVHFLLDEDCKSPTSTANLTPERIKEAGADDRFLVERVTFVGEQEFEDSFSDDVIARALNAEFPREDRESWEPGHIAPLRRNGKFSSALQQQTREETEPRLKNGARKIEIAVAIARHCAMHEVPVALQQAFGVVRYRAGLAEGCALPLATQI